MGKISKERKEEIYKGIKELLDEDLAKMSRENLFAVYGYIAAHFEMGFLAEKHVDALLERLPLSVEDTDEILL